MTSGRSASLLKKGSKVEIVWNLLTIILYEAVGFFYRLWESPVISVMIFALGVGLGYLIWGM